MAEFAPSKIPPVDEVRKPGMDHAHYPFRTLTEGPRFVWPDGARIAFTVMLMLDHWELDPPSDANPDPRIVSPLGKFHPDWLTWSHRLYGVRVGIFRILDVLDRFGIKPSVALGTEAAKRYPELVDALFRRDACFMAHGDFASRRITAQTDDEAARIAAARDCIATTTGQIPKGWCGQDFNRSADTPVAARRRRIPVHHRLGQRRPALFAGWQIAGIAAATGMERSGMHVAAPRHASGLVGEHRRGVRRAACRRRCGI